MTSQKGVKTVFGSHRESDWVPFDVSGSALT